jgi:hypothetical protein
MKQDDLQHDLHPVDRELQRIRRVAVLRRALALARAEGRDRDVLVFEERLDVAETAS